MDECIRAGSIFIACISSICILCISCRNQTPAAKSSTTVIDSIKIETGRVASSGDTILLHSYYLSTDYPCDGENLVMGYNYREHCLDVFTDSHVVEKIQLEQHGRDAIPGRLKALNATSKDSIWIFDGIAICLINSEGKVIYKHKDNDFIFLDSNYAMHTSTIGWYGNDILMYPVDINGKFIIRCVSASAKSIVKEFMLDYPKCNSMGRNSYADMKCPNVSYANNQIIYNYPYDSSIMTIDINTEEKKEYRVGSKYAADSLEPFKGTNDIEQWQEYDWGHPHYYEVCYIPHLDVYVRAMVGGVSFQEHNDRSSIVDARVLYLSFIDKDFKLVSEYQLPAKRYNNFHGLCVRSNGIVIFVDNMLSEIHQEELVYDMVTPVCKIQ